MDDDVLEELVALFAGGPCSPLDGDALLFVDIIKLAGSLRDNNYRPLRVDASTNGEFDEYNDCFSYQGCYQLKNARY